MRGGYSPLIINRDLAWILRKAQRAEENKYGRNSSEFGTLPYSGLKVLHWVCAAINVLLRLGRVVLHARAYMFLEMIYMMNEPCLLRAWFLGKLVS